MDILVTPEVGPWLFVGLTAASFATAFIAVFTGAAGGVILLALMATVMPPTVVIPVHTVVMLGTGITRAMIMWRFRLRGTMVPVSIGAGGRAAPPGGSFRAVRRSWLWGPVGDL